MLLRVISRRFRPSVLCQSVSYHFAAGTKLLRRCPPLVTTQSSRIVIRNYTAKVTTNAIDNNSSNIIHGQEDDVAEANYLEHQKYVDLIKGHLKNKRLKEAIDLVEVRMIKEDQVKPANYIYNLLIDECGRQGFAKKSFELYTKMVECGLEITSETYTALFNACTKSPNPSDALEKANNLRQIMLQANYVPNQMTYNAMIKAYGCLNEIKTAFQLVDEMEDHKLNLEIDTFNSFLEACISNKEFGFQYALLVWQKIHEKHLKPDLLSFDLMLTCIEDCGIGDFDTMHRVIGRILSRNKKKAVENELKIRGRDERQLEGSTEGGANNGDNVLANTTVSETGENEIAPVAPAADNNGQPPNLFSKTPHFGSLVPLKTVKRPEDRLLLLGGISGFTNEMNAAEVSPDIITFTKMLEIIPSTEAAEVKLMGIVREAKVPLDLGFCNVLMKKRGLRNDYEGARNVLQLLEDEKIAPDIVTYALLSLGCKSADDAKNYVYGMQNEGIKINIEIVVAMLTNACSFQDYDYVLEVLHISKMYNLKPTPKFLDLVYTFNENAFRKLNNKKLSKHDRNEFFRFSREFQQWQTDMNLKGLSKEDAIKSVKEHTQKKSKEAHPKSEGPAKNAIKRKFDKKKQSIHELNPARDDK